MEAKTGLGDDVIDLNVGGEKMSTMRSTLCQVEDSLLASMFSGRWENNLARDKDGRVFLDVNPKYFGCILDYLRAKKCSTPLIPMPRFASNEARSFNSLVQYLGLEDELSPKPPEPEKFGLHSKGITLSKNGAVATSNGEGKSGFQHVFGTNTYERGTYRLKMQLGPLRHGTAGNTVGCSYHVGIIKNDVLLGNDNIALNRIHFGYGCVFNGKEIHTYENGCPIHSSRDFNNEGDIFELMLDCDAAMLYISFLNGLQFHVNLPRCSKYRLHVVLPIYNRYRIAMIRIIQLLNGYYITPNQILVI